MPSVNEVVRSVATSGGFLLRKGNGEPGAKTPWLGLGKVRPFVHGQRYERELSGAP